MALALVMPPFVCGHDGAPALVEVLDRERTPGGLVGVPL